MESIIRLACIAHRRDYWESGRTLESLGIDQLEAHELLGFIEQPIPDFTVAHH
jgi:opine dehydrogenase